MFGAELRNSSGNLAFSSTYKNYILHGIFSPTSYVYLRNLPVSAFISMGSNISYNFLPFVQTIDGSAAGVTKIIVSDSSGTLGAYTSYAGNPFGAPSGQTGTSINYQMLESFQPYVGMTVNFGSLGGSSAVVTSITPYLSYYSGGSTQCMTITFDRTVTQPSSAYLYSSEIINQSFVQLQLNGSSSSYSNYKVFAFKQILSPVNSGYGMRIFDASGNPTFDSNQKILFIKARSIVNPQTTDVTTPTLPTLSVGAGSIPTNAAILSSVITRYDQCADNPSPWYQSYPPYPNKNVQSRIVVFNKNNSSSFKMVGVGVIDEAGVSGTAYSFYKAYPGLSCVLAIDTDYYV